MQPQNKRSASKCQNAPTDNAPWFPVFRANDLCQFEDDADAIAAAQRQAWEDAQREGRQHRPELCRRNPWASGRLVDDGIAYAARLAGLEAVMETAARMIAEIKLPACEGAA